LKAVLELVREVKSLALL